MAEKNTALAVPDDDSNKSALPVLASFEKNKQQVQEFLDDGGLVYNDLPQIKIPPQNGKNWEMPDGSAAPTFEAVIIAQQVTRSYWRPKSEDNAPPDCSSPDGETGYGENDQPGKVHGCDACPWAQFGSAVNDKGETGKGQACKLVTNLVLLTETAGRLPAILQLPPTSAAGARAFRNKIFAKDKMRHHVVASFGVEPQKGAFPYNTVTIDIARELDVADVARVENVSAMLLPAISRMFASRVQQDGGAAPSGANPTNVIDEPEA